jgi:hypothetical protein
MNEHDEVQQRTDAKVDEAASALDLAAANPKPAERKVVETPDYGRTIAAKGKDERRTQVSSGFKPKGICEEPECSQPATIELRYRRAGSAVNSKSIFHSDLCAKHAHTNACLLAAFGHRAVEGQEDLWVRTPPAWKVPVPVVKENRRT